MVRHEGFALNNGAVRKSIPSSRQQATRRLIDDCELVLEVSELEKILSQLAYLMSLYIDDYDRIRGELSPVIGVSSSSFSMLCEDQQQSIKRIASEFHLPKSPRLVFWMWRAWLLQKEFDAIKPGAQGHEGDDGTKERVVATPNARSEGEWYLLGEELIALRRNVEVELSSVVEQIYSLANSVEDARYALSNTLGSPQAKLRAAELLLEGGLVHIRHLNKKISEAYGFGPQHRPNKRFDQNTTRNIRAYYNWKHRKRGIEFEKDFIEMPNGKRKSPQQAHNAAVKEASRFESRLSDFERTLREIEDNGGSPTVFFARRID